MQGDLIIKNAHQLLTMQGTAAGDIGKIENGWLYAKDGVIVAVGSEQDVMAAAGTPEGKTVIDAAGKTVLPGFIDCHTHVLFGGSRVDEYAIRCVDEDPETLKRKGIRTGIYASVEMTQSIPAEELAAQTEKRMRGMLVHGTTTLESKSGYGLTMESELKMLRINRELDKKLPMDIFSSFLGAHGWPLDMLKEKYIAHLVNDMIPAVAEEKLAAYGDIWCDEGHYTAEESRVILQACADHGMIPRMHTDAYSYIGGSDLAAEMHMASADHLNYTPIHVFKKLADADVAGVVLPGIELAVGHPKPMNPRPMLDAGMTLALATNCCPGCWCESMQFVLILACRVYHMTAEEAIRAATYGGSKALRSFDRGVLTPGKKADLQIWDVDTYEDIIYKYGRNHVETVIKDGCVVVNNGKIIV